MPTARACTKQYSSPLRTTSTRNHESAQKTWMRQTNPNCRTMWMSDWICGDAFLSSPLCGLWSHVWVTCYLQAVYQGNSQSLFTSGTPGKPLATELINQDCLLSQHLGNMSKAWLRYCGDVIQYTRYSQWSAYIYTLLLQSTCIANITDWPWDGRCMHLPSYHIEHVPKQCITHPVNLSTYGVMPVWRVSLWRAVVWHVPVWRVSLWRDPSLACFSLTRSQFGVCRSGGSFHVKSSDFWPYFHGPPPILLKFGTLVGIV